MGDKRMMTKKEQHEFFLKEIQPYVDIKVKEAKQEEAEEIFNDIEWMIKHWNCNSKEINSTINTILLRIQNLKQKRIE